MFIKWYIYRVSEMPENRVENLPHNSKIDCFHVSILSLRIVLLFVA